MKKSLIAGASVMALAGAVMPMAGVFATDADQQATDTIQVTISPSCTFTTGSGTATYSASGTNASGTVQPKSGNTNVHSFTVFCNNNGGYTVSATAQNLNTSPAIDDKFTYTNDTQTFTGVDSLWNATIAGTGLKDQIAAADTAATIIERTQASATGGESFTATYSAYIGTETPAGVYSGTIAYTLAAK